MLLQHTTLLFVGVKCILPPQICLAFTTFTTIYFPLLWFNCHLSLLTIFHSLFYLFTSLINRARFLTSFNLSKFISIYCFIAQLWNNFFFSYSELKYWLSLSFLCLSFTVLPPISSNVTLPDPQLHCFALPFITTETDENMSPWQQGSSFRDEVSFLLPVEKKCRQDWGHLRNMQARHAGSWYSHAPVDSSWFNYLRRKVWNQSLHEPISQKQLWWWWWWWY